MTNLLADMLAPERLSAVVDIGANPIDGDPPYADMLREGLCTVTGFEPQRGALAALREQAGPRETYLPWAVGDGQPHVLHHCLAEGMTSLLPPDRQKLSRFNVFELLGEVRAREPVETRRLDDIDEIQQLDFLKIDVQGSELMVFEHGQRQLSRAVMVMTEVSFIPLYEGQPVLWEIDRALRELGLVPHALAALKRWPLAPFVHDGEERKSLHQLLEADLVYVRDFTVEDAMDDAQLRHLALLAHCCFGSHDLVTRCLRLLVQRGALGARALDDYFDWIGDGRSPDLAGGLPNPIGFNLRR